MMCGRFTQTKSHREVLESLGEIELPPLFCGRYNIAPTQPVAVIQPDRMREPEEIIWGMENRHTTQLVINARLETLSERPMFRNLIEGGRCLIPADGFYEWKDAQPYHITLPNRPLFAFAGLLKANRCVIITRPAEGPMQHIHHRMPLIITLRGWDEWLSTMELPQAPELRLHPVTRRVNKVVHDDPACLEPADVQMDLSLFRDNN